MIIIKILKQRPPRNHWKNQRLWGFKIIVLIVSLFKKKIKSIRAIICSIKYMVRSKKGKINQLIYSLKSERKRLKMGWILRLLLIMNNFILKMRKNYFQTLSRNQISKMVSSSNDERLMIKLNKFSDKD